MRIVTLTMLLALAGSAAVADQLPAPADAAVYIIKPAAGARVKSPVTVVFGLTGMGIAPAGVKVDNTGHFHLLIDTAMPADATAPLPATDGIRHYGKGQTEAKIELPPGKHTLQLVLADYTHTPFTPNVISKQITITVTK
jgi:hypothetical protein